MAQKIASTIRSECLNQEFDLLLVSEEISELSIYDEMTFGLTDAIQQLIQALVKKAKCTLNAIGKILAESDLLDIFMELKQNVQDVLQKDVKKCLATDGLQAKLK